jgi:hypothetical protein
MQDKNAAKTTVAERLRRMREMFASQGGILVDDYEHFTRQDGPNAPSKAARRLVEQRERRGPKRS